METPVAAGMAAAAPIAGTETPAAVGMLVVALVVAGATLRAWKHLEAGFVYRDGTSCLLSTSFYIKNKHTNIRTNQKHTGNAYAIAIIGIA